MKAFQSILRFWPILIIVAVWLAIVATNYTPGTWLTGWDNLHPEFDFGLNVKRSLTAVWQEYQGLGLLGGMGHAADLPRQLMLWAASIVIPAHMLRWIWTFLMLLAGPLGVYALLRSIHQHSAIDNKTAAAFTLSTGQWAALTAAIFYLFNLATIQVFTAPFDAFVTHYGILPWLLWSNWEFLHAPSRKILLFVAIINIIGMTHAYVPTLFLVYLILLTFLCVAALIKSFHTTAFTRILTLGLVTFCINAFWLLSFTHFTLTKSTITVDAKINQMATQEAYLTNKAFGDIGNVLTLKNFWFDTADYNPGTSTMDPVLGYFRDLERNNWMPWVRSMLAALILFGGIVALLQRRTRVWGVLGILATGMVAIDTVPFVWVIEWLRTNIPLFSQFFRFPFTKWGIALALCYSVWLGIGISWILRRIKTHRATTLSVIIVGVPILLAIIGSIGMLQGHLISSKFKRAIPQEYVQLFAKMKTLPAGRIANLPQNTYWGWTYERWGYSGSGFPWYGIENPILDRAFDPWSGYNENYYWEISRSIYSKDVAAFDAVLNKYDVRYVLLDENVISPSHNRALFTEEIKAMLAALPTIKEIARFGKLTVYEHEIPGQARNDITIKTNLPTVAPAYQWTDNDVAYGEVGDYITKSSAISYQSSDKNSIAYPFRSLFTKRSVDEREFRIMETPYIITIGSLVEATGASILKADALVYDSTKSADLVAENVKPCGVLRDGTVEARNLTDTTFDVRTSFTSEVKNAPSLRFVNRNQRGCLSFGVGTLPHRDGYLVSVESRHITGRPLLFSLINQTAKHVELETYLQPEKASPFQAKTSYFILPPLAADGLGYTVYLSNDAIGPASAKASAGKRQETVNDIKSIKFYRIPYQELVTIRFTEENSHSRLDLESSSPEILANSQPQGRALSVETVAHPNPAYYKISFQSSAVSHQPSNCLTTACPESFRGNDCRLMTVVLSQSFDPGWKAYEISEKCKVQSVECKIAEVLPFLFGTEIKDHVLVNNWANGWRLAERGINTNNPIIQFSNNPIQEGKSRSNEVTNNELTIVLFYLPQLLQWIGFVLLPVPFIISLRRNTA